MTAQQHDSDSRQAHLLALQQEQHRLRTRQRARPLITSITTVSLIALIAAGLWLARPTSNDVPTAQATPEFTLPTTASTSVSLSDYRGKPVVLYFNEGAGCGSCTQQMAAIEKDADFAKSGIVVLPIVMNTAAEIQPDMDRFGVTTPYLLDDGTVSKAFGALDKGMHKGLPGHGFVLIDKEGRQRWQGNYPSMWLDPARLLNEVRSRL